VSIDARSGRITYGPVAGYQGEDAFEYRVCDEADPPACSTGSVLVIVGAPSTSTLADTGGRARPHDRSLGWAALLALSTLAFLVVGDLRRRPRADVDPDTGATT
jgi:hypothetical protein